jgi:peptidoglycan-associated lipoprotein
MKKPSLVELIAFIGLTFGVAGALSASASATAPAAQDKPVFDLGVDYNYVRSNAAPGECGCFSLNGGDGWVGYNLTKSLGAVAEISGQHAGNPDNSGDSLNLISYLFGPRYRWHRISHFEPFGEVLFGGSRATGRVATGGSGSLNAFAMTAGGGLDVNLTRRLGLRAFQADYFFTHFRNGVNDHQNNLRISGGLVLRF